VPEQPLAGRRIVVTRPRAQGAPLVAALERLGAVASLVPLVEVVAVDDSTELDHALRRLGRYDWVVFTSVNGVAAVGERMREVGGASAWPRVTAVGPATAAAARALGAEPVVPERYEAAAIIERLGDIEGSRVLLPQGDRASSALADELRERAAAVDAIVAYRTVLREPSAAELAELAGAEAIVLASGSAAHSLAVAAERGPAVRAPLLACIGPRTVEAARERGLQVGLVADEASADGIIRALVTHFGEER
jgi:uroporphyrinogen-III synthase